jgi:hypothetical protein
MWPFRRVASSHPRSAVGPIRHVTASSGNWAEPVGDVSDALGRRVDLSKRIALIFRQDM